MSPEDKMRESLNFALSKRDVPPIIENNPGTSIGVTYVDNEVVAAMVAKVFIPASQDPDVIEWNSKGGKFSFYAECDEDGQNVFLNLVLKREEDPIFFRFPGDVFLDMLMIYFRKFPFEWYQNMLDEGDIKYGDKKWNLDYYLFMPKKDSEQSKKYCCAISFYARGKDGQD